MTYFLGILSALLAGIVVYIGVLIQKHVINKHSNDPKFIRSLVKSPIWIMGLLLQIVIGGLVFYFIAIIFIGPALVPGLMSAGLIVLALGSVKILKEKLGKEEIFGILLMIAGVSLLGLSELSIDVATFSILDPGFILRLIVFTIVVLSLAIIIEALRRKRENVKGLLMAIEAGLILSLNTVWASPGTTVVIHVADGIIIEEEIIFGIIIGIILLLIIAIGITLGQISLKYGQANVLAPLTSVPIQTIPVIAFFIIFLATPPNILSVIFMIIGFILIINSSFLLSRRQVKLEKISK
ncbi:MAG: DMT family transporter [Promethearchaeota archaeon]